MLLRLVAVGLTWMTICALFFAFVIWPALIGDGSAIHDAERQQCLKYAVTAEEIRQCE